ncbi:unnamed protein product, partial [Prorocentrum cordatum]
MAPPVDADVKGAPESGAAASTQPQAGKYAGMVDRMVQRWAGVRQPAGRSPRDDHTRQTTSRAKIRAERIVGHVVQESPRTLPVSHECDVLGLGRWRRACPPWPEVARPLLPPRPSVGVLGNLR